MHFTVSSQLIFYKKIGFYQKIFWGYVQLKFEKLLNFSPFLKPCYFAYLLFQKNPQN